MGTRGKGWRGRFELPVAPLRTEHHLVHPPRPTALSVLHASFFAQPFVDRQREAGLAARADGGGEGRSRRVGEKLLAAFSATDEYRCEFAEEMRVDERHAYFERMRHRRPVHVAEQLVAEVER